MKKILALNLIFAFLISLVYTNQPAFALSNAINNPGTAASNPKVTARPVMVTVVSLPAPVPIKVAAASSLAVPCIIPPAKTAANLVQDEGSINLNQPANCFSLQSVSQTVAVQTLKVENLSQTAKIAIAYHSERLESPDLIPSPLGPVGLPSLPALSLTLAAAALVFRKKINQRLLNLREQFLAAPQACRLEILRC